MAETGGGKESKIDVRSATAYQVKDGGKRLEKKLLQIESMIKIFNHAPSPKSVAPDIHAFQKLCLHTCSFTLQYNGLIYDCTVLWHDV